MQVKDILNRARRSTHDQMIGGVCAGFAEVTGTPPWLWRAGFAFAALHLGTGVVVYLILWAVMPSDNSIS